MRLAIALRDAVYGCDALIVHNVCTLHKNVALTAALSGLLVDPHLDPSAERRTGPALAFPTNVIAWHHDLAWTSPQYREEMHPGYPWDLLRQAWPGVRHVTVSEARRCELAALYGIPAGQIGVVPPGVDPAEFQKWHPVTGRLVKEQRLLEADLCFLLPARITRRKNIELAIRIVAEVRAQTGRDVRLIVTGPPGPHNAGNAAYLAQLRTLAAELHIKDAVCFLYENYGELPAPVVADLYGLCDALLFPSTEEGFGIPVLEAGLARLPAFCADIPPLRATGEDAAHFFDPAAPPARTAAGIISALAQERGYRLHRRVLQTYTWQRIVAEQLLPLLESPGTGSRE
jgi:glycosyltransferase involved in cell wall biosynthesis